MYHDPTHCVSFKLGNVMMLYDIYIFEKKMWKKIRKPPGVSFQLWNQMGKMCNLVKACFFPWKIVNWAKQRKKQGETNKVAMRIVSVDILDSIPTQPARRKIQKYFFFTFSLKKILRWFLQLSYFLGEAGYMKKNTLEIWIYAHKLFVHTKLYVYAYIYHHLFLIR